MKKVVFLLTLVISLGGALAQNIVPGQVLVQLTDNVKIQDIVEKANEAFDTYPEIRIKKELNQPNNIWLLAYSGDISEQQLVDQLYFYSGVLHSQLNHKIELRETVPTDASYDSQWHHQNIDSELAWDITTGGMTAAGDEIVVCVIEGGNLTHDDLKDNAWTNIDEIEDNGIDDDENGYIDDFNGWNVQSENDEGVFQGGHGTEVMGMIGATGNNGVGVVGANWDVKIMSVAGESINNEASLVEAYGYPLAMRNLYEETNGTRGAYVVATNASWGLNNGQPEESPIWCGLYDTLGEAGILNCGATANNNVNIDVVGDLPTGCASDYMISVTATDIDDIRDFSGYGQTTIDVGAPGDQVWTTSGGFTYTSTSGTSFASPLTAGVIALLYSAPCTSLAELSHLSPRDGALLVRQALFAGVDLVDNLTTECVTGGRINARNSLDLIMESCSTSSCYAPFISEQITEDNVSFSVSWMSFIEEDTYSFRYRISNAGAEPTEWVEVLNLEDPQYDMGELEWCSTYEYQIKTVCSEEAETNWTASSFIETDGCCVSPEPDQIEIERLENGNVELTWSSILAAESYTIYYRSENDAPEIFIEINGISDSNYTFSNLDECTEYTFRVVSSCAVAQSDPNEDIIITTLGCGHCRDAEFCSIEIENTATEWIAGLTINDYSNSSGNDDGYGDYTGSDIILNRGNTVDLNVEIAYGPQTFNQTIVVWIDLNQDGQFDTDEIITSDSSTNTGLEEESVEIPSTALLGVTRLRVSTVWSGSVLGLQNSCGTFAYGEVEDYCVTIEEFDSVIEEESSQISIYPNPAMGQLTIALNQPSNLHSYSIVDATGRKVQEGAIKDAKHSISIGDLNSGLYFIEISEGNKRIQHMQFVKM